MRIAKPPRQPVPYGVVPRLWPDSTIVCLASGPSLTPPDVEFCRGRARVLAVKDTIQLAPWADCLYACGSDASRWWERHGDALADFQGVRFTLDPHGAPWATVLKETGATGLERDPAGLRTGSNSGYQAINLAVHLGASRIVLVGYDMQPDAGGRDHFVGAPAHRQRPPFAVFLERFLTLVQPLRDLGVRVLNATRETALACFEQCALAEAFT